MPRRISTPAKPAKPEVVKQTKPEDAASLKKSVAGVAAVIGADLNDRTAAKAVDSTPIPDSVVQLRKEIAAFKEELARVESLLEYDGIGGEASGTRPSVDHSADDADEAGAEKPEEDESAIEWEKFECPTHCIPICADVVAMMEGDGFDRLGEEVGNFDVITMDPPWQLACANPTRGVAIGYSTLNINHIKSLPVQKLQKNGLIFIWVINMYYTETLDMLKAWGYTFIDDITWVKKTVNRRMAKSHGYYLQHAKETCLVGAKGDFKKVDFKSCVVPDIIYSERLGQSQKPKEIYEYIEKAVPNGKYIEIFARRNNLRDYWFSIGNEL